MLFPHYSTKDATWAVSSSWLSQKILCAAFTFLGVFRRIRVTVMSLPAADTNPLKYLFLGLRVVLTLSILIRAKLAWLQQPKLIDILNLLLADRFDTPCTPKSFLIKFICSKTARITFNFLLLLVLLTAAFVQAAATALFSNSIKTGQHDYFLRNETSSTFSTRVRPSG